MPITIPAVNNRTLHIASEFNSRFTLIEDYTTSLGVQLATITTPTALASLTTLQGNVTALDTALDTRQASVNALKTNIDAMVATHNTNVTRLATINTNLTSIESSVSTKALGVGTVDKATIPTLFKNMALDSRSNRLLMINGNSAGYWDRPSTSINVRSQVFTARYEVATNGGFGTPTADTWQTTSLSSVFSNVKNILGISLTVISGGNVQLSAGLWHGFSDQTFINKGAYTRLNGTYGTFYGTVNHGVITADTISVDSGSGYIVSVADSTTETFSHQVYCNATTSSVSIGRAINSGVSPEVSNNLMFLRWISP